MTNKMVVWWLKFAIVGLAAFGFATSPVTAQQGATATEAAPSETKDLPEAKTIMEDHLEAIGGREKLESIKSTVVNATMSLPALGTDAKVVVYQKTDKFKFATDIPGIGPIQKCITPEAAWEVNPMMGPRLIEGDELAMLTLESDIHADLHPEKYFKEMKCVGTKDIDGQPCYEVELTTKTGAVHRNFYSVDNKHIIQSEQEQETPLGNIKSVSKMSDFREVDGMTYPFKTETSYMQQKHTVTIDEVTVNGNISDSIFDFPEEVERLLKKKLEKEENEDASQSSEDEDNSEASSDEGE